MLVKWYVTQSILPLGILVCKGFNICFQMNIMLCITLKQCLEKVPFMQKIKCHVFQGNTCPIILSTRRNERYLEEIEGKVGKTFYMFVVYYLHLHSNNYAHNRSDFNLIQ